MNPGYPNGREKLLAARSTRFFALREASGCMSVIDCSSGMTTAGQRSSTWAAFCSESLHYLSEPPLSYSSMWKMNTSWNGSGHQASRALFVCVRSGGGLKAENVFNFILLNPTNTCSVVSDPIRDVTWKSSTHQRFLNYGVLQCFNRQMSIDSHSVEQSHHIYICIYCFSFFFYFKESGWLMGSVCAVVALHCPHCC